MRQDVLKKLKEKSNKYVPTEAHIVELDYNTQTDKKVLSELYKNWTDAEFIPMITNSTTSPTRKIFAITTQNSAYDNLNTDEILGIADISLKDSHVHTRFLQANPNIINQTDRETKGLGRSLMQGIMSYFKELGFEDMKVFVRQSEKPFYRKIFPNIEDKFSTADDSSNMILKL